MALPAKFLQWIGVAAIVGLCAAAVAGLTIVKQRIQVTISDEASPDAVDPVGLLRDDVSTLRSDFDRFGQNLGRELDRLATHLDESATGNQRVVSERLDRIEQRLLRLVERHAELAGRLDGISSLRVAPVTDGSSGLAVSDPAHARPDGSGADAVSPSAVSPNPESPNPESPRPVSPAAEKPKRGFLGFSLSTGGFQFDERQRFELIGKLSRVGFDSKSTLHDFTGATSAIRGHFEAALGKPEGGYRGTITVESAKLVTGVDGRDAEMRTLLRVEQHPQITFAVEAIDDATVDAEAMTVSGVARGTLSIAGKTQAVRWPVRIAVDSSRRLEISGELLIKLSDFGIKAPNQLGVITVEDEIKMWVALRARATGLARSQ